MKLTTCLTQHLTYLINVKTGKHWVTNLEFQSQEARRKRVDGMRAVLSTEDFNACEVWLKDEAEKDKRRYEP